MTFKDLHLVVFACLSCRFSPLLPLLHHTELFAVHPLAFVWEIPGILPLSSSWKTQAHFLDLRFEIWLLPWRLFWFLGAPRASRVPPSEVLPCLFIWCLSPCCPSTYQPHEDTKPCWGDCTIANTLHSAGTNSCWIKDCDSNQCLWARVVPCLGLS